jgi:hypothetical protein
VNYWPIINGSYTDYISGYNLQPQSSVTLALDRLAKDTQGAFQTHNSMASSVFAPPGVYFPGASFSMAMWVKWISNSGANQPLFMFSNGGTSDSVIFQLYNGAVCAFSNTYFQFYISGAGTTICPTASLFNVGVWTHVAVTYNYTSPVTGSIYINGILSASGTGLIQIRNVNRSNNYFGYNSWNQASYLMFDEIKIHGRALTAQEILSDYEYNQSYVTFV